MTKKLKTRIGTSSQAVPLDLTFLDDEQSVGESLTSFSPDEKVDILCILEFVLLRRVEDAKEYADSRTISLNFQYLDSLRSDHDFAALLEKRGLKTSLDRIRHGEKRSLESTVDRKID